MVWVYCLWTSGIGICWVQSGGGQCKSLLSRLHLVRAGHLVMKMAVHAAGCGSLSQHSKHSYGWLVWEWVREEVLGSVAVSRHPCCPACITHACVCTHTYIYTTSPWFPCSMARWVHCCELIAQRLWQQLIAQAKLLQVSCQLIYLVAQEKQRLGGDFCSMSCPLPYL